MGKPFLSSRQNSQKVTPTGLGSEGNPVVVSVNNDKRKLIIFPHGYMQVLTVRYFNCASAVLDKRVKGKSKRL